MKEPAVHVRELLLFLLQAILAQQDINGGVGYCQPENSGQGGEAAQHFHEATGSVGGASLL